MRSHPFAFILVLAGLGGAIYFAVQSWRMNADFQRWLTARPIETAIDLSQPGRTTAPYHQSCQTAHGQTLHLSLLSGPNDETDTRRLLDGLAGRMLIHDANGEEVARAEIDQSTMHTLDDDHGITLAYLPRFGVGDYRATIEVDEPAPALAGFEQTVYAMYHLCGLEKLPAFVTGVFAAGSATIALAAGVWMAAKRGGPAVPDTIAC